MRGVLNKMNRLMQGSVLRRKATPLTLRQIRTPEAQRLFDDMIDIMRREQASGLAAPQIGHSISAFVMGVNPDPLKSRVVTGLKKGDTKAEGEEDIDPAEDDAPFLPTVCVNPTIVAQSGETRMDWEGCLCTPGYVGLVPRARKLSVEYTDRHGIEHKRDLVGVAARVFQHEYEHLQGVMYTDKLEYDVDLRDLSVEEAGLREDFGHAITLPESLPREWEAEPLFPTEHSTKEEER